MPKKHDFPGAFANEYNFTAAKGAIRTEGANGEIALCFFFAKSQKFLQQAPPHVSPDLAIAHCSYLLAAFPLPARQDMS